VDCIDCVLDELRGSLPALYSPGGKVIDLRNLVPIGYNHCIRIGHEIYSNRPGFLDRQVGVRISRAVRQSGPVLVSSATSFSVAHEQP
jgi:hypothetical protein